jgi:hypothetical protein
MFNPKIIFVLFFNLFIVINPENMEIRETREAFELHKDDAKKCKEYIKLLENETTEELIAYQAMFYFMLAKHAWLPPSKWNYFLKGKKTLEAVIEKSPNNVELLYLRFIIQTNLPEFLGYYQNIETDKESLLKALELNTLKDEDLVRRIRKVVIKEEHQE